MLSLSSSVIPELRSRDVESFPGEPLTTRIYAQTLNPARSLYTLGTSSCRDHLLQLRRYLTDSTYCLTDSLNETISPRELPVETRVVQRQQIIIHCLSTLARVYLEERQFCLIVRSWSEMYKETQSTEKGNRRGNQLANETNKDENKLQRGKICQIRTIS